MADAAKMDRSSKDVRLLHFIRSNRNLMRAAQNDSKMALHMGIFSIPLPSSPNHAFAAVSASAAAAAQNRNKFRYPLAYIYIP